MLIGLTESVWAVSTWHLKSASGDFELVPIFDVGEESYQTLELHWENSLPPPRTASDVGYGPNVYTYVVQNPWTLIDPLGLKYGGAGGAVFAAALSGDGQATYDAAMDFQAQAYGMRDLAVEIKNDPKQLLTKKNAAAVSLLLITKGKSRKLTLKRKSVRLAGAEKQKVLDSRNNKPTHTAQDAQKQSKVEVEKATPNPATKRRVTLRKSVKNDIKKNQPTDSEGNMIDPNTKEVLKPGEIDTGHKTGQEWKTRKKMHEEKGSTRKEVIEAENNPDLYHLEDRSSNRSHKHEKK